LGEVHVGGMNGTPTSITAPGEMDTVEPLVACLICHACSFPIVGGQQHIISERWTETLKEAVFSYELDVLDLQDVWIYSATNPSQVGADQTPVVV
jgi:hypothetical protein